MTNHPQQTPPMFKPVSATPITVEYASKVECRVRTATGSGTGPTLREAIAAAIAGPTKG